MFSVTYVSKRSKEGSVFKRKFEASEVESIRSYLSSLRQSGSARARFPEVDVFFEESSSFTSSYAQHALKPNATVSESFALLIISEAFADPYPFLRYNPSQQTFKMRVLSLLTLFASTAAFTSLGNNIQSSTSLKSTNVNELARQEQMERQRMVQEIRNKGVQHKLPEPGDIAADRAKSELRVQQQVQEALRYFDQKKATAAKQVSPLMGLAFNGQKLKPFFNGSP
jgi:hypothetical protein